MGILRSEYPLAHITLQRWQKDWIIKQHSLNFSGLVQEMLSELIRQRDPSYFEIHCRDVPNLVRRHEMIKTIISKHPEIISVATSKQV